MAKEIEFKLRVKVVGVSCMLWKLKLVVMLCKILSVDFDYKLEVNKV